MLSCVVHVLYCVVCCVGMRVMCRVCAAHIHAHLSATSLRIGLDVFESDTLTVTLRFLVGIDMMYDIPQNI